MSKRVLNRSSLKERSVSDEEWLSIVSGYETWQEYRRDRSAVRALKKRGLTEIGTKHLVNEPNFVPGYTVGRRLSYDFLKETSLKYKTSKELREKDGSAYVVMVQQGWLKELTKHMTQEKSSAPQRMLFDILNQLFGIVGEYNNRKRIKPLELDIYYPEFNLAFEYNGKYWHSSEESKIKDERKRNICFNENIFLIEISEYSRNIEKDIKKQLKDKLSLLNLATGLKITKNQIDLIKLNEQEIYRVYSLEDIKERINECSSLKEFINKYSNYYRVLIKTKQTCLYEHLKARPTQEYFGLSSDDLFDYVIKTYNSYQEFVKTRVYSACRSKKSGLLRKIRNYFEPKNAYICEQSDDELIEKACSYNTFNEFKEKAKTLVKNCYKRKLMPKIKFHYRRTSRDIMYLFSNEELFDLIFPQYHSANDCRLNLAYKELVKRGFENDMKKMFTTLREKNNPSPIRDGNVIQGN
jgi:hypothetical protein